LTHTDLKPENILFERDDYYLESSKENIPEHVLKKKEIFGSDYGREGSDYNLTPYMVQRNLKIKLIDFGGAIFSDDHHSRIVNTRHYRSPEVILGCGQWNEKSDIWSLACILIELYTGELLFSAHKDLEHLALIEKLISPLS
jgi:serine/threonine protein kinase